MQLLRDNLTVSVIIVLSGGDYFIFYLFQLWTSDVKEDDDPEPAN